MSGVRATWYFILITSCTIVFAQQKPRATGLIFADPARYQSIPLASPPLKGALPKLVDLSPAFPRPGDQGSQGSCVGWAVAHMKTYQEKVERNWSLTSSEHIFSPSYIYNQIVKGGNCQAGSLLLDAMNLVADRGAAPLAQFPYSQGSCAAKPSKGVVQSAREFRIAYYQRANVQSVSELKNHLAAGMPIVVGLMVDDLFSGWSGGGVYSGSPNAPYGHAMVVVGYSDAKNAFRLINSYGPSWGDDGYIWISYESFGSIAREGYVSQDIVYVPPPIADDPDEPKPAPSPKPAPAPVPAPTSVGDYERVRKDVDRMKSVLNSDSKAAGNIYPSISWLSTSSGKREGVLMTEFASVPAKYTLQADAHDRVFRVAVSMESDGFRFAGEEYAESKELLDIFCRRMARSLGDLATAPNVAKFQVLSKEQLQDRMGAVHQGMRNRRDKFCADRNLYCVLGVHLADQTAEDYVRSLGYVDGLYRIEAVHDHYLYGFGSADSSGNVVHRGTQRICRMSVSVQTE